MERLYQAVDIFPLMNKAHRFAKCNLTDNVIGKVSIITSVYFNKVSYWIRGWKGTHVAHDAKSNFLPVLAKSLSSLLVHSMIRESMSPSIGLIAVILYCLEVSHICQNKNPKIEDRTGCAILFLAAAWVSWG